MSKAGGSKADTAVKLVLIFFISLLSFTVGTLVGGQFEKSKSHSLTLETEGGAGNADEAGDIAAAPISDEDVDSLEEFVTEPGRKIASADAHASPTAAHNADAAHDTADAHAAPTAKATDGYTHASKIRPAAEGREVATHSATAHSASAHATPTHAAVAKMAPQVAKATHSAAAANHETNAAVEHAADRLAHDKAPTADVTKPRAPSNALPIVANSVVGKYTVQVASYATEGEAKGHAGKLQDKGYDSFYLPAVVSGKTWYRVSVGRFEDQASATNQRKKILETSPSAIVQRIIK